MYKTRGVRLGRPTPLRPCGSQSTCRCTACCRRLRSASAGDGEKGITHTFNAKDANGFADQCDLQKAAVNVLTAKQPHPAFRPVHTEHLVFMGRQVVQRSFAAVPQEKYRHLNRKADKYLRQRWQLPVLYFTWTKIFLLLCDGGVYTEHVWNEKGAPTQPLCRSGALICNNNTDDVPGLMTA